MRKSQKPQEFMIPAALTNEINNFHGTPVMPLHAPSPLMHQYLRSGVTKYATDIRDEGEVPPVSPFFAPFHAPPPDERCTTCGMVALRSWKVSPIHTSIITYISSGRSLRKIAKLLDRNHSTVIRHLNQLEKRGYVSRQVRSNQVIYSILPAGMELMHHPVSETITGGSKVAPPRDEMNTIRLHRLQIKFDLVNYVEDPTIIKFTDYPSKVVHLEHWSKNIIQFENFTAIVSTRSLIIAGVQRYLKASEDVELQQVSVMKEILPFAEQVEEKIRKSLPYFRLKRLDRGVLSGKILSREFAYEHHPIAEKAGHMRIDNGKGKPRIIVDSSKGFPELEAVDRDTSAEDMEHLRSNTELLASVDMKEIIAALKAQTSVVSELSRHASATQDQIDQIISVVDQIASALGGTIK